MPKQVILKTTLVLLFTIFTVFAYAVYRGSQFLAAVNLSWTDISSAATSQIDQQKSHTFLILGIGGSDHEGPNLTDTILLASYNPHTHTLTSLGLPRDIWDTDTQDKINATYTYALAQKVLDPSTYTRIKFERITGLPIDHLVIIDFATFAKTIDILGGIEVQNDVAFTDPQYPIAGLENKDCIPFDPTYGCRYESVSFIKGPMQMDGSTALKFVRSRHAVGDEGTDFARSHRQQMVLTAVTQKILRLVKTLQTGPIAKLVSYADAHVARTLSNKEAFLYLADIFSHRNTFHLSHQKLPDDFLIVPPAAEYEDRYVLVPKDKNDTTLSSEIQKLLK